MDKKEIKTIREHYLERIKDSKCPEYKVLDWESKEAQEERFNVFINNFNLENSTVLDIGCGLIHLAECMEKKYKNNNNIKYIGVDIIPEMISRAKDKINNKKFSNISVEIFSGDVLSNKEILENKTIDYIYSSGIFNLNFGDNKNFLKKAIKCFKEISSEGFCFNVLDISAKNLYGEKYFYFDRNEVISYTKTILKESKRKYSIKLISEYLHNDFSIAVYFN